MTINWFPGHMNKARRELAKALSRIDLVIEMVDARLPRSSQNPMLAELRSDKPCIKILNRGDLADPVATREWMEQFDGCNEFVAITLNARQSGAVRGIPKLCRRLAPHRVAPGKTIRTMVVGIPNVGKSTLINTLVGRPIEEVGDRPAVTKGQHRIHLDSGISVADTPGVLWPKLEDQLGAQRLAASGAIRDTAFDYMQVAAFASHFLRERYPEVLRERFGMESIPTGQYEILEAVGRRRGFLKSGGVVDVQRAAETLLRELRSGKLGRISFERPADFPPTP
ncbi:MAG: ribosome biogenesis GTPase YlqF [Myxococcota bacterium]